MRMLLWGTLVLGLALPCMALDVTQGELVTLRLNLTNTGEVPLKQVQPEWQAIPDWLTPLPVQSVSLGVAAKATLPVNFQVHAQAPLDIETVLVVSLVDADGSRWPQKLTLQVLPRPVPEHSRLLPSFPNPCNPETWIPYQLQEASDVRLGIYDVQGRLVRELVLGYQEAGWYTSREQAAHWDGCNAQGETVSSGMYLVHLQAGEYHATRKLLVRR